MSNRVVGKAVAYRTGHSAGYLRALRFRGSCYSEIAEPLVNVVENNRRVKGEDCRASRRDCRQQSRRLGAANTIRLGPSGARGPRPTTTGMNRLPETCWTRARNTPWADLSHSWESRARPPLWRTAVYRLPVV